MKQRVNLPELDEATAHTLINYLYTQKYQSLRLPPSISLSPDQKPTSPSLPSYKLSTRTYTAATTYVLPGLAELAKERITSLGEDVDVFDILDIARDYAYPTLPESDEWYTEYLEGVIRSAMKEDAERFRQPGFLGRVDRCGRLLRVVWGAMMSGFGGSAALSGGTVSAPVAREEGGDVEFMEKDKAASSVDVSVSARTNDSGFVEPPKERLEQKRTTPEHGDQSLKLDDMEPIEPILETPQAPEMVEDEIDFKTSKMGQQWGKKLEQSPVREKVVVKLPERPKHARADSVMENQVAKTEETGTMGVVEQAKIAQEKDAGEAVKQIEPAITEKDLTEIQAEVEAKKNELRDIAAPLIVDGSSIEASESSLGATKKDKKKSKKKKNPTTF